MSIEVKNLSCRYGRAGKSAVRALDGVSFTVGDGEFVGIMGRTGCGKSTLIQLIAGLLTPDSGQVLIDGEDINSRGYDRSVLRKTVGIVFQYPECQLFETTVEKDVAFALRHCGLSKEERDARVRHALEDMGFCYEDVRRKSPLTLSGGEKRRAAIAGVLAAQPRVLIFDEPVAGLDPLGRLEFVKLVRTLNSKGTTVIMVSHNADILCECAQRILVLDGGKLCADGCPDEIFADLECAQNMHIGAGEFRLIAQSLYEKGVLSSPAVTTRDALVGQICSALKAGDAI